MRSLLLVLILLFSQQQLSARDFGYTVKIVAHVPISGQYFGGSGVVFKEDKESYYILSCNHIFENVPANVNIQVMLFAKDNHKFIINTEGVIIRRSPSYDLSYLKIAKDEYIDIAPVPVANGDLLGSENVKSYGFPGVSNVLEQRELKTGKYDSWLDSSKKVRLLTCYGRVDQGMSGGPLIGGGYVHGILVHKNAQEVTGHFIPAYECNMFLKETEQ